MLPWLQEVLKRATSGNMNQACDLQFLSIFSSPYIWEGLFVTSHWLNMLQLSRPRFDSLALSGMLSKFKLAQITDHFQFRSR